MHVSAGLGTTFVPFRFAARPEATELVLQGECDEHAGRGTDGRDARDDAERLPPRASGGSRALGRATEKRRWIERIEDDSGCLGRRLPRRRRAAPRLDAVRAGAASSRARRSCPPGRASDDAFLVTCAYLVEPSTPWVMQSLFLTAIGEARERHAPALETFAYRYPRGRVGVRALRGAPHRVPARLPRRLRLPHAARAGPRRAVPPRARRAAAGARGQARGGDAQAARGLRAAAPVPQRIP